MDNMEELLQKLLKTEKERRKMSDDTNTDGSGGTKQENTNDEENGSEVSFEKKPGGVNENDVKVNGELTQKIIQDCENKYELIMDKSDAKAGGRCYLHKMNDTIYQKNCKGDSTEGQINIKYEIGAKIEDSTLLSKIAGIEGCTGKDVFELIPVSGKKRNIDEYEKRLAEGRGCSYCNVYETVCNWVCAEKAGWWWSEHCARQVYECASRCKYDCR